MPRPALSLAVVGADFPNKRGPTRRFEIALCKPGEPVELRREPKNPADPRAIAIYSIRGVQLGYLSAERVTMIGGIIADGIEVRAVFQRRANFGAVIRAAFDGEEPVVPGAPVAKPPVVAESDSGFWPDPEWPD